MTQKDFEDLFACLMHHRVKALIVGAHAVAFHAKPRFTKDIDILVEASQKNAVSLVAALEEFGFGEIGLTPSDFVEPGRIVQLGFPPSRIDIITSISGVSFEEAWNGRVTGTYGSQEALYIGKAELIRAKRSAARPQDLVDVATLTMTED